VRIWLVLLGVVAAGWLLLVLQRSGDDDSVPMVPLAPAPPPPGPTEASVAGLDLGDSLLDRTAVAVAGAPDSRPAELEVRVVVAGGGPPADALPPLPSVEVALHVVDGAPAEVARTSAQGLVSFTVLGGDRRAVQVRALGASLTTTLSAAVPTRVELRVVPRAKVVGRVVDTAGRGIADADLVLLPWASDEDPAPPLARVGRSAGDGSFALWFGCGGRLGAIHRGYGPSSLALVAAEASGPPRAQTLELVVRDAMAAVSGRVVDAAGQPVAGAELEFRSAATPPRGSELAAPPMRGRSDSDGAFRLRHLIPGPTDITVRARGHAGLATQQLLAAGGNPPLRLQLGVPCRLTGSVCDERNTPVAGALVIAGGDGLLRQVAKTQADGTFALDDLAAGSTPLRAQVRSPDRSKRRSIAHVLELTVAGPNVWAARLSPPDPRRELFGVVARAEQPLVDWTVLAVDGRQRLAVARTGSQGEFTLQLPRPGACTLRLYAPGRAVTQFADSVQHGIDPLGSPHSVVVAAAGFGTVRGVVRSDAQQNVPARLGVWHHQRAEYLATVAGADGTFVLAEIPPGTVDLDFEHPGLQRLQRAGIVVSSGGESDLGVVALAAAGILHGVVRGPDGQPPSQVQVTLLAGADSQVAVWQDGSYRFASVPPGKHTVQVQAEGAAGATFEVTVAAGQPTQRDVDLVAGVSRTIRVLVPAGAGPQISLALQPEGSPLQWAASQTLPGQHGGEVQFVAWMAPGQHEAVAWSGTTWRARQTIVFAPGATGEVRLTLERQ
jgi:protocatechuate 3,4-dioxygenase beta subunit